MEVGGETVFTISEAATRYGLSRKTLLTQIRRGVLAATKSGNVFLVTASEMERYDAVRKAPRGFARDDHPMHGKQGPGHRRKASTDDKGGDGRADG